MVKENKTKYVLLFNAKIPMCFDEAKEYNVGSGFIALKNKTENTCFLCRFINENDDSHYDMIHILQEIDRSNDTSRTTRPVVILSSTITDFEMADAIVENYYKAFSELERMEKK